MNSCDFTKNNFHMIQVMNSKLKTMNITAVQRLRHNMHPSLYFKHWAFICNHATGQSLKYFDNFLSQHLPFLPTSQLGKWWFSEILWGHELWDPEGEKCSEISVNVFQSALSQSLSKYFGSRCLSHLFFQQSDLHLQISLKILIQDVFLDSSESAVSSVSVILQQLLRMFDPHAVMTAAHAAVSGSRGWTLIRSPCRGATALFWLSAVSGVS